MQVIVLLVCAAQLAYLQVVNDYINPFWVTGQHYTADRKLVANPIYSDRQYPIEDRVLHRDSCQLRLNNNNLRNYEYLIGNNGRQHEAYINERQAPYPTVWHGDRGNIVMRGIVPATPGYMKRRA